MVRSARNNDGRSAQPSFIIVDAQSVKNTDTAEHKGYDAGKKVSGIKRHIAVDTQGLPQGIGITTAEVSCHIPHDHMDFLRRAEVYRGTIFALIE